MRAMEYHACFCYRTPTHHIFFAVRQRDGHFVALLVQLH